MFLFARLVGNCWTDLDAMNIEKLANKKRVVNVYVYHLDNKPIHCTKKQSRKFNLETSVPILDIYDSEEDDGKADSDFEDERMKGH